VAHELAKQAMFLKKNCIWDDDAPSFIVPLLANDVTILNQYSMPKGLSKKKNKWSPAWGGQLVTGRCPVVSRSFVGMHAG
jgi:hypothetical protein